MKAPAAPRPPGPPHNPGVRELVAGKRKWASSLTPEQAKAGFKGWHERGYLPHRDEPGLTQMVTFHVADSFPTALRGEWAALLEIEDDAERRIKLQAYLDKGRGDCPLRNPRLARLVDGAFRFYHGSAYELRAWVVMPNHVHVLFKLTGKPMGASDCGLEGIYCPGSEQAAGATRPVLGVRLLGYFHAELGA